MRWEDHEDRTDEAGTSSRLPNVQHRYDEEDQEGTGKMIARPVQALHYQMYSTDITRKIKKALER
jgi:hypothetical protein